VVFLVMAGRMLLFSERFQISESLVEKCEVVGEVRPPCRVARISVLHRRCIGSILLIHHWSRGLNDHVYTA